MATSARHQRDPRPTEPPIDAGASKRIAWGAVFAGAILALMVTMLINLLLLWIGGATVDPTTEENPLSGLGLGSLIGLIISNLVALFVGGLVAGRLANKPNNTESTIHGLLVWSLLTIVSFLVLTSAVGTVLGGVTSALGKGLSLAGEGVAAVAPEAAQAVEDAVAGQKVALEDIKQQATQLLKQVKDDQQVQQGQVEQRVDQAAQNVEQTATEIAQSPGQAWQKIEQLISELLSGGQGKSLADAAGREDLVDALTQRTNMSESEAKKAVDNWAQTYQEAQQALDAAQKQLTQAAQQAAEILSSAAMWTLLGLILGAIVAVLGSIVGSPKSGHQARAA